MRDNTEIIKKLSAINRKICCLQKDINNIAFEKVTTYDDLPPAADHTDEFFVVENSQGTSWLPGSLGGTFYAKGFYYSNGVSWVYAGDIPYQATLADVNAGTVTDQFVTPYTLSNTTKWSTKADTSHTHAQSDITNLTSDLAGKASSVHTHSQSDVTNLVSDLAGKQATLVSGVNLKTVGGVSLLGGGDLPVSSNFTLGTFTIPNLPAAIYPITIWYPPGNAQTVPGVVGQTALVFTGNVGANSGVSTADAKDRLKKYTIGSSPLAGGIITAISNYGFHTMGDNSLGGFLYTFNFATNDSVAGARMLVGLRSSLSAGTNVNPSTLTNTIGVAQIDGSANLHLCYGGSSAQTPIDLGANYPAYGTTNAYRVIFYAPTDYTTAGFKLGYYIDRLGTTYKTSGTLNSTLGTQLPATTTILGINIYRTNNVTATQVKFELGAITVQEVY